MTDVEILMELHQDLTEDEANYYVSNKGFYLWVKVELNAYIAGYNAGLSDRFREQPY